MNTCVLEVSGVRARYGTHEVLQGVDLNIARGEWFCLLGPNGVGKSTLLNCIAGRLPISAGLIKVCAYPMDTHSLEAKHRLGVACAPEQLPGLLTGRQCLEVYALAKGLSSIDTEILTLAEHLRFTGFMNQCVDTYSLGTRQKLAVLLALLGDPQLIVLDEAFNGLDPASALTLKQLMRERLLQQRCGVLLATHSLDIVEHYADAAALMLDGRVAVRWDRTQIDRLRDAGGTGLESALAAAQSTSLERTF